MAKEEAWAQLTDIERTCLQVCVMRTHAARRGLLPPSELDAAIAESTLLPDGQLQEAERRKELPFVNFIVARTNELDAQLLEATAAGGCRQAVLIGAGMDTRAWRLSWPAGTSVFEVDTPSVLALKRRVLAPLAELERPDERPRQQGQGEQQQQQQQQLRPLACARRCEVPGDAEKAKDLWARLLAAGLDPALATVFVAEGLFGYLEREAGDALLATLRARAAPGSRLVLTAPPTPQEQQASAAAAAAAAAVSSSQEQQAAAAAHDGAVAVKLHHKVFEAPEATLRRVEAAGWRGAALLTGEQLAKKHKVPTAQPVLLGHV